MLMTEKVNGRNNRSRTFFLHLRDMQPKSNRDIEELMVGILDAINKHPRSTAVFDKEFLMFQEHGTHDYVVYLQCSRKDSTGFNRCYFTSKKSYGAACLFTIGL